MRDLKKSKALKDQLGPALAKTLEIKELDVSSEESIRRCVDSIAQRKVDVLGRKANPLLLHFQKMAAHSGLSDVCCLTSVLHGQISHPSLGPASLNHAIFAVDQKWIHCSPVSYLRALG